MTIKTTTVDDVTQTTELKDAKFREGTEIVAEFPVPARLASIHVTVEGKV